MRFSVSDVSAVVDPLTSSDVGVALADRGLREVEACYRPTRRLVDTLGGHGLLTAVHEAYAEHRPLALSPDHVWLCVAQGVARHVLDNAESLRDRFVAHDGRRALEVRRDDFVPGDPGNDWPAAIATLSDALREILGEDHGLFVAESSTTDATARTAGQIVLMGALQQYFSFTVSSLCGIPNIELEGTSADWTSLVRRVDRLDGLGLEWWLPSLRAALTHFARAADGDAPESVWRQFYKAEDASGGLYTSGWINALFPFLGDQGAGERNPLVTKPIVDSPLEGHRLGDYGNGLAQAPFDWKLLHGVRPMSLLAGFVGVTQDDAGRIRPEIGWAVCERIHRARFHRRQSFHAHRLPTFRPRAPVEDDLFAHLPREAAGLQAFAVSLSYWAGDLRPLATIPGLAALELHECPALTSLDSLRDASLVELRVTQCRALADLAALRHLPELRVLHLWHLDGLDPSAWTVIAELEGLTELGLFGRELPESWRGKYEDPAALREVQAKLRR